MNSPVIGMHHTGLAHPDLKTWLQNWEIKHFKCGGTFLLILFVVNF